AHAGARDGIRRDVRRVNAVGGLRPAMARAAARAGSRQDEAASAGAVSGTERTKRSREWRAKRRGPGRSDRGGVRSAGGWGGVMGAGGRVALGARPVLTARLPGRRSSVVRP